MRLIVDTTVLVGELLRAQGRERIADDRLDLFLPEQMWEEVQVELPRGIDAFARKRSLAPDLADELKKGCFAAIETNVDVVDLPVYSALEDEARSRSLRDPNDWPLVACCLALGAAVWTDDNDLFGTGVPTWTTQTLQAWLDRNPSGE
ncbi:MAG TPA: PIN domain-containing protein [Candidatus Dormibacteraeota bacterium]|nr:PIN domain-containing protein [Candidatus Dormibacteraeota bacterium]